MRFLLRAAAILLALSTAASSQTAGQLPAGTVIGNSSAVRAPAKPVTPTSLFDQAYCNTVGYLIVRLTASWTCAKGIPVASWLGAADNVDDTSIIQAAINAAPGSEILFDKPINYKISTAINLGNGNSSTASTDEGTVLRGVGNPSAPPFFTGYMTSPGPKLTWIGSASTMIQVNGPLQGWGIKNLTLDCASTALVGIKVSSAQFGDSENLNIINCRDVGFLSTSYPTFGSVNNTDSSHNKYSNTTITVPNVANAVGILLTGVATGNTSFNSFNNTTIDLGSFASVYGILLQATDTDFFINTHIFGGAGSNSPITFDYNVNADWPSSVMFFGIDTSSTATWQVGGTPSANARCNYVFGLAEENAGVVPNLANLCVNNKFSRAPITVTNNYTVLTGDSDIIVNGSGSVALTLPSAAAFNGRKIHIKTVADQTVTSATSNVIPLIGGSAGTAILAGTAGKWADVKSDGTDWIIMAAN